jgi:hypothetical protein
VGVSFLAKLESLDEQSTSVELLAGTLEPERFIADGMRFIAQFQLTGRALELFKQRYG